MNSKGRLLVVDDEANITDLLAMALRYEGFDVATAATGSGALEEARSRVFDLIVLDVMLPDIDGFEVARQLVSTGHRVPVLFLTARDATSDKVRGLTVGGDDYVTKPFSLEEVMARIRAILRRTQPESNEESRIEFADIVMDLDTREVWRGERSVDLTDTEFRLLRYLMQNPRRVLTRGQILDHVWDYDFGGDANVLDTYIHYLRRKLDGDAPRLIQTVRGVGYSMRLPPESA